MEQFEQIALQVGVSGLILFMGFIVYDLARKSKAGKLGALVLFVGLFLGVVGFIIKTVLYYYFDT